MKKRIVCLLLLCSLASLTACGKNAGDGAPGAAQDPEPTAALEVPGEPEQTWFERSGLSFTPAGEFRFRTYFTDREQPMENRSTISIRSTDNGDGTKTIQAILGLDPPKIEGTVGGGWLNCGFVDQYTGTAVLPLSTAPKTFSVDWKGRSYSLTLQKAGAQYPLIENNEVLSKGYKTYSLTCPSDYDGAAFFVCGSSGDIERHLVFNRTKPLEMVDHGDYDLRIFDGSAKGSASQTAGTGLPETAGNPDSGAAASGETADLTGQWKQVNSLYEDCFLGAVIEGETLELYWFSDNGHTRSLYWSGPFSKPTGTGFWTSQNDRSKTDGAPLASHDDALEFTYGDGQICCIASMTGAERLVRLERADWMPEGEPEKSNGTPPEERTESGFDPAANQTLSFWGLEFSIPAHFDILSGHSDNESKIYEMEQYGSECQFAIVTSDWKGLTQEEFDGFKSELTYDQYSENAKDHLTDVRTGEITVAGLSGWLLKCREDVDSDTPLTLLQCVVFNPANGRMFTITMMFFDDDTTHYDYAGDFQKILDAAVLDA